MEASAHRSRAREALRGNWVTAVLVCLLAGIISGAGTKANITFNFSGEDFIQVNLPTEFEEPLHGILGISLSFLIILSLVMVVVGLILGGVMELGKARYHMNLIDGVSAQFEDLFCGFPQFVQALVMALVRDLLIVLGMLLIVPGIIKSIEYAMTPFIVADEPELGCNEAIEKSMAMMRGKRWQFFKIILGMIGWIILAVIPCAVLGVYVHDALTLPLLLVVICALLLPYYQAVFAKFYLTVKEEEAR